MHGRKPLASRGIFHCVKAHLAGQGGRTTFSDTKIALENLPEKTKSDWINVTGFYERKMEFYESKTTSPLVTRHPYRDFFVIRYNEPHHQLNEEFINPPRIEFTGLNCDSDVFHNSLRKILYNAENCYAHEWQDGNVVIADNFSLLHGREAFRSNSPRHLRRVQVLSNPPFKNPGLESYR